MALLVSSTVLVYAAPEFKNDGEKSELNADEVEYNMDTGVVTATGNVILKHGIGVATGLKAMYNTNTEAAYLTGNVIVVRDNLRLTCDSLNSDGYGHAHVSMDSSGQITYCREAFDKHGAKNYTDFQEKQAEYIRKSHATWSRSSKSNPKDSYVWTAPPKYQTSAEKTRWQNSAASLISARERSPGTDPSWR